MLLNLLVILKKYWKPIVLFLGVVSVLLYGYNLGSSIQEVKCETKMRKLMEEVQIEKQILQDSIDKLSTEYQEKQQETHSKLNIIERKYNDEKKGNPSIVCHADNKFVQLYNEITQERAK